jgi:hypothetical protein
VKVLTSELENPLNVHRWRKLEGSDPEHLDLIARFNTLQKRLIGKTEEVVERDILIAEKERLVEDLKARLASVPGGEVVEQLSAAQHALNERTRQLKSLASEANMHLTQASEARYEVERISRELAETKRALLEAKKKRVIPTPAGKKLAAAEGSLEMLGAPPAVQRR